MVDLLLCSLPMNTKQGNMHYKHGDQCSWELDKFGKLESMAKVREFLKTVKVRDFFAYLKVTFK